MLEKRKQTEAGRALDRIMRDIAAYDEVYLAELWGQFDHETSLEIMRFSHQLQQKGFSKFQAREMAEVCYR